MAEQLLYCPEIAGDTVDVIGHGAPQVMKREMGDTSGGARLVELRTGVLVADGVAVEQLHERVRHRAGIARLGGEAVARQER